MKYRFIKEGKSPTSEEIKGAMDFDEVTDRAGTLVGVSLASSVLKGFSVGRAIIFSVAVIAVVASVSYVANPEYTEAQFNHLIVEPLSTWEWESTPKQTTENSNFEPTVKPFEEDSLVINSKTEEPLLETESEAIDEAAEEERANSLLLYEDLLVRAKPLPTTKIFLQYIDKELEYPLEALNDSIEGYVEVFFKVNERGETEDFKISKSLGEAFDNEAIRVIKNYRNWKPAVYLGEAQEDFLKLKVTFTLQHNSPGIDR
ncbi:MAG: TonB family protein [Cytophagia bacterium]|nr:TonB family protein [Cytophagia bacterium]